MNFHADQKPINGTVMKSIIPYSLTGISDNTIHNSSL